MSRKDIVPPKAAGRPKHAEKSATYSGGEAGFIWVMAAGGLLHWFLLLVGLARQSLWIDEWFTLQDIGPGWAEFLPSLIATERRPPLYWVALKIWGMAAGESEFALRFFSAAASLTALALAAALARRLFGRRTALLVMALASLSPFLVLYGRMLRSYSLFSALALAATLAAWRLARWPCAWQNWLKYTLAATALLYTDYGAWPLLAVHVLLSIFFGIRRRHSVRTHLSRLSAPLTAAFAFLPWLGVLLLQSRRANVPADLSNTIVGLALKLSFPFAAWGAGETIYPWHPLALASIGMCILLAGLGVFGRVRRNAPPAWLLSGWLGLSLLFTAAVLSTVAQDITFLNMASRAPHAAFAYYLAIAAGLVTIRRFSARVAVLGTIGAVFGLALLNYFTGRAFHNPIYAIPMRAIVHEVAEQAAAADMILAEPDTLFGHYYLLRGGPAAYRDTDRQDSLGEVIAARPPCVWLVTFGRDRTAVLAKDSGTLAAELVAAGYRLSFSRGYGQVGPSYRWVKEHLLHRPAYEYKLVLCRYDRPAP